MDEQIGWGVLGTAAIADRKMIPTLTQHPAARLTMIGSRKPEKAAELAARVGVQRHGGYQDVLDDPAVAAVYIPLPNALHVPWTEQALRAGKHVLVEKPLALEPADAERLFRLARSRGLTLMECMTFPRHSQHAAVAELTERIGPVRTLAADFTIPDRPADDIRYDPALGGGALADLGVYVVRAAQYFLGTVELAQAQLYTDPEHPGVDVGGHVRLSTVDGRVAELDFGIGGGYRNEYRITGDGGTIEVGRAFTAPPDDAPQVSCAGAPVELPADDHFANTVTEFTAALGSCPDAEDTVAQLDLVAAIRRSAVTGPRPES